MEQNKNPTASPKTGKPETPLTEEQRQKRRKMLVYPLMGLLFLGSMWLIFAPSEKEKADIVRQLEGKKFTVQRSKGLGENDPEMMWLTTMNPETRRLVRVLPDEAEETARVFDLLLGDNLAGRKDYIAENGHLYLDMIDVS